MKHKAFLLLGFVLLFSNRVCAGNGCSSDSLSVKVNWKMIKEKRYSLSYHSAWTAQEGSADGIALTLMAPGPKSFGGYEENINLAIHDLSGKNMDLDSYTRMCERQIHTMVSNSKIILSERSDTTGTPFHQILYIGDYNEQLLKWKMRFWVAHNKVYVLTYTATKENFGLYIRTADEIMDTFKLR